jgi:hypothetical protein
MITKEYVQLIINGKYTYTGSADFYTKEEIELLSEKEKKALIEVSLKKNQIVENSDDELLTHAIINGYGVMDYPDGQKHTGNFKLNKQYGYGIWEFNDDEKIKLEGRFVDGFMTDGTISSNIKHTFKKFIRNNDDNEEELSGRIYKTGTYIKAPIFTTEEKETTDEILFSGDVIIQYDCGYKFEMKKIDNKIVGKIYKYFNNGEYFIDYNDKNENGEYTVDMRGSEISYLGTIKDGKKVKGTYKTYFLNNKTSFVGEWDENGNYSKGRFVSHVGAIYDGELKEGKRHGRGKYTFRDNRVVIDCDFDMQKIVKVYDIQINTDEIKDISLTESFETDQGKFYRILQNNKINGIGILESLPEVKSDRLELLKSLPVVKSDNKYIYGYWDEGKLVNVFYEEHVLYILS